MRFFLPQPHYSCSASCSIRLCCLPGFSASCSDLSCYQKSHATLRLCDSLGVIQSPWCFRTDLIHSHVGPWRACWPLPVEGRVGRGSAALHCCSTSSFRAIRSRCFSESSSLLHPGDNLRSEPPGPRWQHWPAFLPPSLAPSLARLQSQTLIHPLVGAVAARVRTTNSFISRGATRLNEPRSALCVGMTRRRRTCAQISAGWDEEPGPELRHSPDRLAYF